MHLIPTATWYLFFVIEDLSPIGNQCLLHLRIARCIAHLPQCSDTYILQEYKGNCELNAKDYKAYRLTTPLELVLTGFINASTTLCKVSHFSSVYIYTYMLYPWMKGQVLFQTNDIVVIIELHSYLIYPTFEHHFIR